MGEFAIGQGVPRFEDPRLVSGRGSYVDDVVLPRMVHGFVLRSPHAAAFMEPKSPNSSDSTGSPWLI